MTIAAAEAVAAVTAIAAAKQTKQTMQTMQTNQINSFRPCLGSTANPNSIQYFKALPRANKTAPDPNSKTAATGANGIWLARLFPRPRLVKYQLRAGLAFLAVCRRNGSILAQIPTGTSVALVLILTDRAAQGGM